MLLSDTTPSTVPEHNDILITRRYCLSTEKTTVKRSNYEEGADDKKTATSQ
jgi:hypothetical protein